MGEWTDEWMDGTCLLFCCCFAADEDDDDGDATPFFVNPYKLIHPATQAVPKRAIIRREGIGYIHSLVHSMTFAMTFAHCSCCCAGVCPQIIL